MPPPRDKDPRLHAVAEQLINARLARGWSRETLAEKANVHVRTVINYEQSRCAPQLFILLKLLQAMSLNVGWFSTLPLNRDDAPPKPRAKSGRPKKVKTEEEKQE